MFFQLHNYAGDFVVSTMLATLLYLTLEEPILLIESYIYKRIAMRTKTESNWVRSKKLRISNRTLVSWKMLLDTFLLDFREIVQW